ncbi:hypothetical protein LWI28_017005 [Acer negundo]|uniref:Reverse transcriptase Ty1/copia-type domain-containing protein n=1 Tax=Acer negundo TaxID=4023 RepID=A0AAD5IRC1_ACENE|nr:hypothetical protein LWI28_017005 [Acer negundo]
MKIDDLIMLDLCVSDIVNEPKENHFDDTNAPLDVASNEFSEDSHSESSHNNEHDSDVGVGSQEIENALNDNQQDDQVVERPHFRLRNSHYQEDIIGDLNEGFKTRNQQPNQISFACYTSQIEPKHINEAIVDEYWVGAMQDELNQFKRNEVWFLVLRPKDINMIGVKWVFRNKTDESGKIVRNKIRLVAQGEFEMSMMGELNYFLGMQVKQTSMGIMLNQSKYARNLVKMFGLESGKEFETPMSTTVKLGKDEKGKSVDQSLYRSMIGSLLYLTASRPDICFSVDLCARFQANPNESHLKAVKRIIRYIKRTHNLNLFYSFDTNDILVGYCDDDWAGNVNDRKSTFDGCFYVGNNLVSWSSKKQNSVSLSFSEAVYIAAENACTQLLWMK